MAEHSDNVSAGFSIDRLQRLDKLFQGYLERGELPCASFMVGRRDKHVFKQKYGWQDFEAGIPLSFGTIFRIMSMTKPVTAVAAMLLYEEGRFDLNTPIEGFLPVFKDMRVIKTSLGEGKWGFENARHSITFRHLMTHTSGIGYYGDPVSPLAGFYQEALAPYASGEKKESLQDFIKHLAELPLAFHPGDGWLYGFNLDVLGALVEVISDLPLEVFLEERIFRPLGMVDTGFDLPEGKKSRLAVVYLRNPANGSLVRQEIALPMPVYMWGGGGLVSSLEDFGRFAAMLANRGEFEGVRLLSPTTVSMFSTNFASPEAIEAFAKASPEINAGYGYSLGTAVLLDPAVTGKFGYPGEFYWGGAFSTYFWIDPIESLYGVFMTQLNPNWAFPIPWQVHQLVYQALIETRR
jgi:CubicO group peptidase (beta-lactamase class C family)